MKKIVILLLLFIALCAKVFAQTNSYCFDVKKSGKGKQPLILIPGFACSGDVWKETLLAYEKDYTCYSLTMAGFADAKPRGEIKFKVWEASIAKFIKDNSIQSPVIIGHSMGGGLALALAADYPELISKIIVVDALPCLSAIMDPTFTSKENNNCSVMTEKMLAIPDSEFYKSQKASIPRLLSDTSKFELVVGWSVKSDRKTFSEMYCDFSNTDLREKIKNITCPSLILLESYFVNFKPGIESQYKNLKTANIQYANKGLHFIMYDDKEWYFDQLHNFLPTN